MSIAAAENAGLGPCELPLSDQWLVHTQLTSSQQSQSQSSQSQSQYSSSSQTAATQQQQHSSSGGSSGSSASHQHLQPKIMNAVVPAVSVPAASKKIRRKPDTKPQSQINKCNNEKRRRELENEYIEQLGEFLQINKRDMTACKPDKAAILSEVVRTFRRLLEQGNRDLTTATGNRCSKCSPDCSDSCKLHPVQQGEVSSTEPPLPEPSVNGHSPEKSAYFEAVQYYISNIGWALLEINSDGVIECATENVRDVLHYSRNELHGQSIYSYLHTGDHSKLSPILNKNSFELNWDQDEMFCQSPKRTIRTKIRWLLRAPDSANDTIEQKQQRQEKYKDLLIISAQVKDDTDAESSSVLCLITLPEDELNQQQHGQLGQLGLPGSVGGGGGAGAGVGVAAAIELSSLTMPQTLDEQLTLKLDMNGAIIDLDAATLRKQFAGYLTKEAFRSIHDLCHFQDRARLNEHLNNVMNANGTAQVSSYRLRLGGPDVYVHVKAQTRLFRNSKANNEPDFIMAIHTILTDSEVAMVEAAGGLNNPSSSSSSGLAIPSTSTGGGGSSSGGSGSSSSSRQLQQITQGVSNMGGPLMSSIINGGAGGNGGPAGGLPGSLSSVVSPRSNPTASLIPPSDSSNFFNSDFEFEFPHSTFDMESVGVGWDSRPDSRTSVTPVSTPRPPSVTAYSPAAAPMCPSPLTPYHAGSAGGQPSPSNNNQQVNNNNNNNSMTNNNAGPFGSNFPFPFDDKEKIQEQIHQQQNQQQQQQQQQQMASHDSERLRNLLTTKRPHSNASSSSGLDMDHDHRNPNRILKLLNEKSDDDDLEGRNRPSELLRQLQKVKDEPKEHPAPLNNEELIQMLRFQGNDRKRPSNEPDEGGAAKRPSDKPSKLCEKNKMLASLLANPAKAPTPLLPGHLPLNRIIPDIPISNVARQMASVTSSTPPNQQQQTINNNNLTTSNNNLKQVQQMNHQLRLQQQQHQQQLRKAQAMPSQSQQPPTSSDIYLSQHQQQQQQQQQAQVQAQQQALLQAHLVAAAQQRQQNFSPAIQDSGIGSVGSGTFATPSSATSTTSTPMPEWDSELNEILNHVIDIAPEGNFVDSELNSLLGISSGIESSTSATPSQSSQQDIQEKLAINAIQKSLMQIENVTSPMQYSGSPPAYPMHGGGMSAPGGSPAGGSQQAPTTPNPNFTPPPVYTPRVRMSSTGSSGGGGGGSGGGPSGGQMGNGAPGGGPNALTIQKLQNHQQQRERIHQEQQRQRLLQQQKQQQMVVPVNATANADMNLGLTPGMQNIESLLNNTVAPNVSLTRANSVVPDSQLSPGFSPSQLMQQQLSPNQRTQLSPQQTGFQGSPFNNNPVHRMSPQQVGGFPQQQPGTPGSQQLSPRQPPFASNPQVSQPNALQQQQQWQNANARLSIQQQNPMLNAQLSTIPGYNPAAAAAGRQQFVAPQRQRSLNSPGTPRQGSFGGTVDGGGFPGPPSPSQPGQNFNNPAVFAAAAQQMRLQRQGSVPPQATQHLPGSPRPSYGGHGPGPDAGGYGMMFSQAAMQQHTAGSPGDYFNRVQTGGANGGGGGGGGSNGGPNAGGLNSSELVRQELRAVVSGRAQNAAAAGGVCGTGGLRTPQSPIGMSPGMVATAPGGPGGGGGNVQGPGSASSGGAGGGGGIGGNGDSMQTSQLPGTSSSSSLLHPAGDMDPSMLFNFHLTPKEFFGGNTSR